MVAEIGQGELEAIGKLARVGDGLWQIGEQTCHFSSAFQMPLGVEREQAAGFLDSYFVADAGEDVERRAGLRSGVACAVGGEQRQLIFAREIDESLVAGFLGAVVMALQFDEDVFCAE